MLFMWDSNELEWKQLKGAFKHNQFMLDIIHIFVPLYSCLPLGLHWENEAERDESKIYYQIMVNVVYPMKYTIAYRKPT